MSSQYESMMEGLQQALDFVQGDESKGTKRVIEKKKINVIPLTLFTKDDIKNIRIENGLTQKSFADCFGVSIKTVEGWERGVNKPSGSALRLLQLLDNDPDIFEEHNIAFKA